jgi:energy-coupling factor transport system permease protein
MGLKIELIPGNSFLHRLDPRPKFLFFIITTVIVIFFTDPIFVCAILIFIVLLTRLCGLSISKTARIVKASFPMLVMYTIVNVVLAPANALAAKDPANVLFYVFPPSHWLPITPQGIVYSSAILIRFVIVIYTLQLVLFTTPVVDIILALIKWKTPASVALGTSIGFNFVPVFMNTARSVMDAQLARGWRGLTGGNMIDRVKALPIFLAPLFLHGIDSAQKIAVAIEARGFGYNIEKRTFRRDLRLNRVDYATLLVEALVLVASVILWYEQYGTYMFTYSLLLKVLNRI